MHSASLSPLPVGKGIHPNSGIHGNDHFFKMFIYFGGGGVERWGWRILSGLCGDSSKRNVGLKFTNPKIMT